MIERGNPAIPLRIEDAVLFEDFGDNWDGGVYRVRNHKNESLRGGFGDPCGKITDDTSVDLTKSTSISLLNKEKDVSQTYLEQIISKIVVNVSVIVVVTGI